MKPGASMMRFSIVGTTKACVAPSRSAISSHRPGSKAGRITSVRPEKTALIIVVAPAMWKNGTDTITTCGSTVGSAGDCVFTTSAVSAW